MFPYYFANILFFYLYVSLWDCMTLTLVRELVLQRPDKLCRRARGGGGGGGRPTLAIVRAGDPCNSRPNPRCELPYRRLIGTGGQSLKRCLRKTRSNSEIIRPYPGLRGNAEVDCYSRLDSYSRLD